MNNRVKHTLSRYFFLIVLLVQVTSCNNVSNKPQSTYIPSSLEDSFIELERILETKDVEEFKASSEKDLNKYHFGFGLWMRNSWGLWGGSRLAKWFNGVGIEHPDDMSSIILLSYWRNLNGIPVELEEQILFYQNYWKTVEEEEKLEAERKVKREELRKKAKLDWQWGQSVPQSLTLPRQPDWKDVWGLSKYDGGFIVVTKGYRREHKAVWHDGIYFLQTADAELSSIAVEGCEELHDVIVQNKVAIWLCRSKADNWRLVETQSSRIIKNRQLDLPTQHAWLRLAAGNAGLLLISENMIYKETANDWELIFSSKSKFRDLPKFDSDEQLEGTKEYFFPQRSATPIQHSNYVYFQIEDSGNETELYRLNINVPESDLESMYDFFTEDYIGQWVDYVSVVTVDAFNLLWVASHNLGTLYNIDSNGLIGIATIFDDLDYSGGLDQPADRKLRVPVGALLHDREKIYLAGHEGVAEVVNGKVSPIIFFVYPEGMSFEPYTSRPQYDYHIKPQRLGLFDDGSFVIGDRHDGIYSIIYEEGVYRFHLPMPDDSLYMIRNK